MAIKFPERDDLPLANSPLKQVICQVRFAPLLRIGDRTPTAFQEALRGRFPHFATGRTKEVEGTFITVGLAQTVPTEYVLKTADGKTEASLAIDFVSLVTNEYSSWEAFGRDLELVLRAFESSYEIPQATRIGLRYINDLKLSNTGTDSAEELVGILNPELSNLLLSAVWDMPAGAATQLVVPNNGDRLGLRMGYDSKPEPHVVLDLDYFTEADPPKELSKEVLVRTFHDYHKVLYNAFRWTIREDRLAVFQASPVGGAG